MKEYWFSQFLSIDDQFKILRLVNGGKYCYVKYNREGTPNQFNLEIITQYSKSYIGEKPTKFPIKSVVISNFDIKKREYKYFNKLKYETVDTDVPKEIVDKYIEFMKEEFGIDYENAYDRYIVKLEKEQTANVQ